ncbi:MAG: hypothetical protein LBC90_02930, partial [Candidatus Adiutrix sp.]|nr:hypothetical protein [Candidatus Adiutrix sp.]
MIDNRNSFCYTGGKVEAICPRRTSPTKGRAMNAREITYAYDFLSLSVPSKECLPALGILNPTMHKWALRGYFPLENVGRGRVLFLSGEQILHLYALNLISNNSGSLKLHTRGLRDCVSFYAHEISQLVDTDKDYTTYCCLRFVLSIRNHEWVLSNTPL